MKLVAAEQNPSPSKRTITTEQRKRGFFGWLMAALFWIWQALMVAWFISAIAATSEGYSAASSEAARTGAAVGTMIGLSMIAVLWACGSLILGMLMFFTRGKKTLITQEVA